MSLTNTVPFQSAVRAGRVVEEALPVYRATAKSLPPGIEALLACADLQGRSKSLPGRCDQMLLGEALPMSLVLRSNLGEVPPLHEIGIILAGDFYSRPQMDRRGGSGDTRSVWRAFSQRCRWVAGVAGNHDVFGEELSISDFEGFRRQPRTHFLDGGTVELDGLKIAGLSGTIGNPRRPYRRFESDYVEAVRRLCVARPDILVLHDGPDFPHKSYTGSPAVRSVLEQSAPTLVIRGHVHWDTPLVILRNGTQVLNVNARAILISRE